MPTEAEMARERCEHLQRRRTELRGQIAHVERELRDYGVSDDDARPLAPQAVASLIGMLIGEGVTTDQIEKAIVRSVDTPPGRSVTGGDAMRRAFAFEQAGLFERHWRAR